MGTACSCDAELEVTELDVQSSRVIGGKNGEDEKDLQYDLGQDGILGCSSFGTIVKTRCPDGRGHKAVRAVKRISKRNIEGNWKNEVQVLQKLDHPHVCKLHETLEDLMSVYLVMELCQGGNLMTVSANRERFSEGTAAVLVRQMASAVAHLHAHEVFHSDIRPENWLFEAPVQPTSSVLDMTLKMIDFGLASKHGRSRRHSGKGRISESSDDSSQAAKIRTRVADLREFRRGLCCVAPEQVDGHTSGKADIWALGVLSYFLLSGQSPFELDEGVTSLEKHLSFRNARFVFMPTEIWRPVSSEAKNFVAQCLQKDSDLRPSAARMLDLPWMRLAQGLADEEREIASPGRADSPNSRSKLSPLPTAAAILGSLERMKMSQILEKATIITAARGLHAEQLSVLRRCCEREDARQEGVLPIVKILHILKDLNVPCADMEDLAKESDLQLEYDEFVADISEFQCNMQDSAACGIFRAFDGSGSASRVKRKVLAAALHQTPQTSHQKSLADAFPQLNIDSVVQELDANAEGYVDFDTFQQMLRNARRNPRT